MPIKRTGAPKSNSSTNEESLPRKTSNSKNPAAKKPSTAKPSSGAAKGKPSGTPRKTSGAPKKISTDDSQEAPKRKPRRGTKDWYESEEFSFNRGGVQRDKVTGEKYIRVPRPGIDGTGQPKQVIDFDASDLTKVAKKFLPASSRTPLSREEVARLRAEKVKADRQRAAERAQYLLSQGYNEREEEEKEEETFFDPDED